MGTLIGHVAPGFGFFAIGFWHLFNHLKLHLTLSHKYRSLPWFPASFLRHLELYLIMLGCVASVSMELFIGPQRHEPLDTDGTIPSNHLHNFEHSSISLAFFVYASSALLFDFIGIRPVNEVNEVVQFLASIAFALQLLLFHFHSADHMGVEGQYHWLLQLVIFVSLCTALMGISKPRSFMVGFVRSISILFQGVWLMTMGFMLWTPQLIPKGCFMYLEDGHKVVRCHDEESLERAKSLVNIEFSWFLIGLGVFAVTFYLVMVKIYGGRDGEGYLKMSLSSSSEEDEEEDVEAQKKEQRTISFVTVEKPMPMNYDMER